MNTPWGKADYIKNVAPCAYWVGTPGHGGLMIARGTAKKVLTAACVKRGQVFSGYLAYEEDCQYALVAYERPEWFIREGRDADKVKEDALKTLSAWNADYLIERGIEPDAVGYSSYLKREDEQKMRDERHPDLIVSAISRDNGVIHVWTADGREHDIEAASYKDSEYRLSKCRELSPCKS